MTLNDKPIQPDKPQTLLRKMFLNHFLLQIWRHFRMMKIRYLIRRVMDGMKNNIEFEVEAYGKKAGVKNDVGDLKIC